MDVGRIEADGATVVNNYKMDDDSYKKELFNKLIEEALELKEAVTAEEFLAELADVTEFLELIMEANNVSYDLVREAISKKQAKRGGFSKRVYVEDVVCSAGSACDKFLSRQPEKYGDGTV